jgi:LPXTG-site transpeptidase (sortase) family protein
MAEKLSPPRKRLAQSGRLLAVIIAATALLWHVNGLQEKSAHQLVNNVQTISTPGHRATYATRSIPLRIAIPSISVDSTIIQLGLEKDGTLAVPQDGSVAGWYTGSPTPGEIGPSVVVGHVDWKGKMGVFFRLRSIKVGARVKVLRVDGSTQTFKVERIGAFAKTNFPSDQVYGDIAYAGLRLITCGDFNFQLHKYVKDIVVFAEAIKE